MQVEWDSYSSPLGPLTIAECDDGPLMVEFPARAARLRWPERLHTLQPRVRIEPGPCQRTRRWLDGYFAGHPPPLQFPYHLGKYFAHSPAQIIVWWALWSIPLGETRSYDDIACNTGLRPRHVGQLIAANHLAICIPCHRVVGKRGGLVGYGGGLARKRWLLSHELRVAGVVLRAE